MDYISRSVLYFIRALSLSLSPSLCWTICYSVDVATNQTLILCSYGYSIVLLLLSSNVLVSLTDDPFAGVVTLQLSSNYLACWSPELGQWGWPCATLAPSSNTPSQQAWSLCSLEVSRGVLIMQINVSHLLVMLLLVVLRNIISQVLVPRVPFHDELFVVDLIDHIKVILLHRSWPLSLYSAIHYACSCQVVTIDWSWWLWMPHLF